MLAVVPARSGSKGVPNKNLRKLCGTSLIGWAGRTLSRTGFVDRRIISTDSPEYAKEAEAHGLAAPFLRPPELSGDTAGALETMQHALRQMEEIDGVRYDIILIVEPTSPFRLPEDIERTARRLLEPGVDSAVAVIPIDSKWHPDKALRIRDGRLGHYTEAGHRTTGRQALQPLYTRSGVCYAMTRECLMETGAIVGNECRAELISHPVVNIDEEWELHWAEFMLSRGQFALG